MVAFGGIGLFSAPLALMSRFLGSHAGSSRIQDLMWTGTVGAWMWASMGLGTLLALLLLGSGVGVLRRQRWARKASLAYAISAIAFGILAQLVNIVFLYPKLMGMLQTGSAVERGGAIGGLVGGIFGGLFGMILPIAVLIVVTRPSVRAELA